MKSLFTILIITSLLGCREKKENERYFFISYNLNNGYETNTGNFTSSGTDTLPSKEYFKELIFRHFECDGYSREHVIITGFHEFKDSSEFRKWVNPIGGSMDTCENDKRLIFYSDTTPSWKLTFPDTIGKKGEVLSFPGCNCDVLRKVIFEMTERERKLRIELNSIKAKQSAYRYAVSDTNLKSLIDYEWEMVSGSPSPLTIPASDTLYLRNPITGEFDIKVHRNVFIKKHQ